MTAPDNGLPGYWFPPPADAEFRICRTCGCPVHSRMLLKHDEVHLQERRLAVVIEALMNDRLEVELAAAENGWDAADHEESPRTRVFTRDGREVIVYFNREGRAVGASYFRVPGPAEANEPFIAEIIRALSTGRVS